MSERLYAQAGEVVLVIERDFGPSVFLYTFMPDGFVGDNWCAEIETAKAQAASNTRAIPGGLSSWQVVPENVGDLNVFARDLRARSVT
jgi:hypothetical protein